MASVAAEQPRRELPWRPVLAQLGMMAIVLAALYALWEGFKWFGETTGLTIGSFEVNDKTFPHLHDIVGQLFEPSRRNGPLLIEVLWDAALFTAKEAAVGFVLGASIGFVLGVLLAHSRLLQRGFLPYIVASQTIPILAVAPLVVIWFGGRGFPDWFSVSIIAAFLTFFPVAINTLRGLTSVDPRALEHPPDPLEPATSRFASVPVHRLQDLGDGLRGGRDHRRAARLDPERSRRR